MSYQQACSPTDVQQIHEELARKGPWPLKCKISNGTAACSQANFIISSHSSAASMQRLYMISARIGHVDSKSSGKPKVL
jgi:hypothetical protein